MSLATSIRSIVRKIIIIYGSTSSQYKYSEATVVTDDEGAETVTWGTANSITLIPSNHTDLKRVSAVQGEETIGDVSLTVDDQITVALKDKITYEGVDYKVVDTRPIYFKNLLMVTRIGLKRI